MPPDVYDRYAGILERFAANAEELVSDIWKKIAAKGHGSVVSPYDFDHLIDEELSSLHIIAIFNRLEREDRLFKLDGLEYWAVSLDGVAPDAHVVAAMLARRKEAALGMPQLIADGFRYPWSGDDLKTVIDGVILEFVHDGRLGKGAVN